MLKRLLLFVIPLLLLCLPVLGEDASLLDSGFPGSWIETEGFGTLTIYADGTATMEFSNGIVAELPWALTDEGAIFTDGMWYNSPMVLLDENTLSVDDGWSTFAREGFLPTTDKALLLGAEPVGEAGYPFCGKWVLDEIILEGESYDPAFAGITLEMTFTSNGLVTSDDGVDVYTTTWFESYGSAVVEGDVLTLNEEGKLVMEVPDGTMIFTLVEPEIFEAEPPVTAAPEINEPEVTEPVIAEPEVTEPEMPGQEIPEPEITEPPFPAEDPTEPEMTFTPVGEEGAAFLGLWSLELLEMDGMQMDPALFGMSTTLTFSEDGSVQSDDGMDVETLPWHVEDGVAIVDGLSLTISEDDKLLMHADDGAYIFTRGEAAPAAELSEEEQLLALLALLDQLAEMEESNSLDYLNTKFVCAQYTVSGFTLDADTLGSEYSLFFREDGTADLILGGIPLENLPYTINEDGVYAVNYYGTFYNCTPTETGFDMDYYGTMTLHCVPAE